MADYFLEKDGQRIVEQMICAIQENKAFLGEIDGLIGDGDHGMNMNKGFTMAGVALEKEPGGFSHALNILGTTLFNDIGGSMGPIYGTIFIAMADTSEGVDKIDLNVFATMLQNALTELGNIIEAQVGDKTLIDTLMPASQALQTAIDQNMNFSEGLTLMKEASEAGKESTKDLVAKYGRSSRLGERSRGTLDAGATSCNIILQTMADEMIIMLDVKQ